MGTYAPLILTLQLTVYFLPVFSIKKDGKTGSGSSPIIFRFFVTNSFFFGRTYIIGSDEISFKTFFNLGYKYSTIKARVSSGKSSSSWCIIFSQIPLNGEFLFRYLLISGSINFLREGRRFLSASANSSGLTYLVRSSF